MMTYLRWEPLCQIHDTVIKKQLQTYWNASSGFPSPAGSRQRHAHRPWSDGRKRHTHPHAIQPLFLRSPQDASQTPDCVAGNRNVG